MSLLKNLMVETKTAWISYPGIAGFEVEIAHLTRPTLISLRKRCTITKFDKKHQHQEVLDEDKFVKEFAKLAIKNWKGLKYKYLEDLVLVDLSSVNPEEELPYSLEEAIDLIKGSTVFDTWINDNVYELDNFRTGTEDDPMGEAEQVS